MPILTPHERTDALGSWGENIAKRLLGAAGFSSIRYLGKYHPFADYYAERH
jgi:hypothetical protein